MSVLEIVEKYLKDNGYGGLFNPDDPCGCRLNDLFPCGQIAECKPGYDVPCSATCSNDNCDEYRRGEEGVWCIQRNMPTDIEGEDK